MIHAASVNVIWFCRFWGRSFMWWVWWWFMPTLCQEPSSTS